MKKVLVLTALLLVIIFSILSCGKRDKATTDVGSRIMLFSSNWGEHSIRITNDVDSFANGATATPRIIVGSNVPLPNTSTDSLAVDRSRSMIYVTDANTLHIIVYHNADTATGNIVPNRTISITSAISYMTGVAIDSGNDRLYVASNNGVDRCVFILNNASTLSGSHAANAVLTVSADAIFIDSQNDRLYVGQNLSDVSNTGVVSVYDNASALLTGASPNRTITISSGTLLTDTLWVDAATDKLYYGSRNASVNGYNLFIFNGASTLAGSHDADAESFARIALPNLRNVMVDNGDRLYMWENLATTVKIFNDASTLSGNVIAAPDKIIGGVVNHGYGMDYLSY
jgi:hypothetical protein